MEITQAFLIAGGVLAGLLTITLGVLFFVSRKSQKVMESLLSIMTRPERAKVADAVRVLNTILADEIYKIELLLKQANVTTEKRPVIAAALKKAEETVFSLSHSSNVIYVNTVSQWGRAIGANAVSEANVLQIQSR